MTENKRNLIYSKKINRILEDSHTLTPDENGSIYYPVRLGDMGVIRHLNKGEYAILPEVYVEGLTDEENFFVYGDIIQFFDNRKTTILLFLPTVNLTLDPRVGYRELGNIIESPELIEQLTNNQTIIDFHKTMVEAIRG